MPETPVERAVTPPERGPESPHLLGDPVRAARAAYALEPDAVRAMLTAPAAAATMDLLGISELDRTELLAAIETIAADAEMLAAITEVANLLRAEAGLDAQPADLVSRAAADSALQGRIRPGQGLIAILGHLVATDSVRAWHAARGIAPEVSWAALADLGQQMRVHRRVFGELGLHTVGWTALAWTGRLIRLGRLQFELWQKERGLSPWALSVHIPATGPLSPDAVDASLTAAAEFFPARFGDLSPDPATGRPGLGHEFVCFSWLVAAELPDLLGADSNLGSFAARWDIEETFDASEDAAFFVFSVRPPYDPRTFPERTRLERAVRARLLPEGPGWTGGRGRMTR